MQLGYHILDWFFLIFHTALVLFNISGWAWKATRKLNLICLLLTAGSWIFLGIFYGFGYCPLTDWHFDVLRALGESDLPASYIKYLFARLLGINISASFADAITGGGLVVALIISVWLNVRDYRRGKA